MTTGDYVVLLHGIFRTKRSMAPLAKFFTARGYQVINIGYPSYKKPIEELIEDVRKSLGAYTIDHSKKIHFIGYSLGGLIVRAYLNKYKPENMGRVVQLGTPNQGSEAADFGAKIFLYKYIYGPAGMQLVTDQTKFRHIFGEVNYELGIIAGNVSLDPILSMLFPGENDGKVSVERSKLPGMKDHIIVRATHTFMPRKKVIQQQALQFIEHGIFRHDGAF